MIERFGLGERGYLKPEPRDDVVANVSHPICVRGLPAAGGDP